MKVIFLFPLFISLSIKAQQFVPGKFVLSRQLSYVSVSLLLKQDHSFNYAYMAETGGFNAQGNWVSFNDTLVLFQSFSNRFTDTAKCTLNKTISKDSIVIKITSVAGGTTSSQSLLINGNCRQRHIVKNGTLFLPKLPIDFIQIGNKKFVISKTPYNQISIDAGQIWKPLTPSFYGDECWIAVKDTLRLLGPDLKAKEFNLFRVE